MRQISGENPVYSLIKRSEKIYGIFKTFDMVTGEMIGMEKQNAQKLHDKYTDKVISYMEQDGYKLLSRSRMKDGSVYDFVVEKHDEIFQVKTLFLSGKTDLIVTLRAQVLLNRIIERSDKSGHFVLITNGRLYKPWKEKYKNAGIIVMDCETEYPWNN